MAVCDYMHMQLWHLVPQRGDIELVALGDAFQRTRRCGDFTEQLHLRILLEIDELYETGQARHQDQPRIVGVVRQQRTSKRQVADRNCVLRELRVQRPAPGKPWIPWTNSNDSFRGKLAETPPHCLLSRFIGLI